MIEPDFLRLVRLGAIELELRRLESGGCALPSAVTSAPSLTEIAMRTCLLANVGERVLRDHKSVELEVSRD